MEQDILENLEFAHFIKKFSAIYWTQNFITVFTKARSLDHMLSQVNVIHILLCFFKIHFNIILLQQNVILFTPFLFSRANLLVAGSSLPVST
jgi:hypothetical protein